MNLDIRRSPFFLYSDLPKLGGETADQDAEQWCGSYPLRWGERLDQLYGRGAKGNIGQLGKSVGYNFNFDVVGSNTFDSHRMLLWAEDKDVGVSYGKVLARKYFEESQLLSDHDVLVATAVEVGLDAAEAQAFLQTDGKAQEVRSKYEAVRRAGVSSIPVFLFEGPQGRNETVHGSSSVKEFAATLERLLVE